MSDNRQAVLGCRHLLTALLFAITITLRAGAGTDSTDPSQYHTGMIVSVRELRSSFPMARWSGVHEFTLHFAVHDSDHFYCYEFRSVILEDVADLRSSSGHFIRMLHHEKKLNAILEDGRTIKADLTKQDRCSR